jgi:hypothetical protein
MSKKEIATLKKDLAQKFVIDSLMQKGNITKEALQPFETNFDFIQLIQKFKEILGRKESKKNITQKNKVEPEPKKPVDWTMQLAVINYLRRLFKYEKQIFNQAFYGLKIYENIIDFFNSIRSVLAQNALVLINEIFSEYVPELDEKNQKAPIINLIKITVPVLIQKANRSQSFIKNEAKTCLETLVTNMKYNESLITLLQLMNTKKIADFELIYTLTLKLIKNVGKQFFINNNQFESMMSALGKVYESNKSDLYKKKCKSIIKTFNEVMTKEEFDKNLEKCAKKEKEKIKEILEERIPPNTKKEIHHHELKSKDNNKSVERPKSNCIKKQISKKLLNIKLIDSKIQENKNCENINNTNINLKKEQIV